MVRPLVNMFLPFTVARAEDIRVGTGSNCAGLPGLEPSTSEHYQDQNRQLKMKEQRTRRTQNPGGGTCSLQEQQPSSEGPSQSRGQGGLRAPRLWRSGAGHGRRECGGKNRALFATLCGWRSLPLMVPAILFSAMVAAPDWTPTGISLHQPYRDYVGPDSCSECHPEHSATQRISAHFMASTIANERTVLGPFQPGRNRLATVDPAQDLVMEVRDGFLQQSLVVRDADGDVTLQTGSFAIALGAVKGQTYLYWRDDVLYQLPASYISAADAWAYSPGYPEGVAYFDRAIKPECMECHATVFEAIAHDHVVRTDNAILGVTCEACHGPGRAHVRDQHADREDEAVHLPRLNSLSRTQQVELCGFCHSGVRPDSRLRPAFSFRPGDRLVDFFELKPEDTTPTPEVHGNQMGLLQQSRCYQESELTCTTCHDPHRDDRGELVQFAARCITCHDDLDRHPPLDPATELMSACIDCHMPLVNSKLIVLHQGGQRYNFAVRNHRIGIHLR